MFNNRVFLSPPHMGGNERKFIDEAFASNYIAPLGPMVTRFEKLLCQYSGASYCAAVSAGTAAIHLALLVLGVKPGNRVICSSFTFCGSVNPILYVGAKPVFIDSEPETWNMDPELMKQAIEDSIKEGEKPAAIIMVHLYGMPGKIDRIMEIANHYEIPVIEDAAEALGTSYKGKKLGTYGTIGIYSFNGNKIITTSGGGAMVTENPQYTEEAVFLATQARDKAPHYEHTRYGYNYRMSNIVAAIGCGQMEVLSQHVQRKREINNLYRKYLADCPWISFQTEPNNDFFSNYWLTTILLDPASAPYDREELRLRLEANNVESRPLWKPLHLQPVFKAMNAKYYGNGVCDHMFDIGLCLPAPTAATDTIIESVCSLIKN